MFSTQKKSKPKQKYTYNTLFRYMKEKTNKQTNKLLLSLNTDYNIYHENQLFFLNF